MPPGSTAETVAGWSGATGAKSLEASRAERGQGTPVKRVCIDKPKGGNRPRGRPGWSEKVGQDRSRSMLAASYAPPCSTSSHGGRPHRGGHTARNEGVETWMGSPWCIAGASKGGVEHIDHASVLTRRRENLHDKRCLRLLAGALQAGDGAAWPGHPARRGRPQGGRVSPRLAPLSMHRGESCVHDTVMPEETRGTGRQARQEDERRRRAARLARPAGERARAKTRRPARPQKPSVDPNAAESRRLRERRDAEDVFLGDAGTRAEAPASQAKSAACLAPPRPRPLSAEQTLLTPAPTSRARCLGDAIGTRHRQTTCDQRRQRTGRTPLGVSIPADGVQTKRQRSVRNGTAPHRVERLPESA